MKWPRRILLGTLIAAGLITALWWEENWRGQRIWDESCARLRAAGHPVEVKEIIPPPVPDELNVAMAPIFADLVREGGSATARIGPLASGWVPSGTWHASGPMSRPLSRMDLSQVDRWASYLRECFPPPAGPQASGSAVDEVLRVYAQWEPEWKEIRAALERPHCRWPLEYERGFDRPRPHLAAFLKLANNSRALIAALAAKGDAEAYAELLLTLMKLERCIGEDPESLLPHLVSCTMTTVTLVAWQHSVPVITLNETQLSRLQSQLGKMSPREAMTAMQRDAVNFMHIGLHEPGVVMVMPGTRFPDVSGPMSDRLYKAEQWMFRTVLSTRPHGWTLGDLSRLQDGLHASGSDCVDAELGLFSRSRINGMMPEAQKSSSAGGWYSYTQHTLPSVVATYQRILKRSACTHAMVRCAMVWCATERFRLKHGRLPRSQDELVPTFLKEVQVDPIGGGPLHFVHRTGGNFLIYSPGWDGKDDGGMKDRKLEEGDLGWTTDPLSIESAETQQKWVEEDEERAEAASRPPPVKKPYKKRPVIRPSAAP